MDNLISQVSSLDVADIASILRQVQGGALTVEETPSGANLATQSVQDDSNVVDEPSIIETVHHAADALSHTDSTFDPLSPSRHISLRRPGRQHLPSTDVDIPVPQSKTELQKQIFQTRMMGAPTDVAERITQKTGLGSTPHPRVKPNIGVSRSSHHAKDHDSEKTGKCILHLYTKEIHQRVSIAPCLIQCHS